MGLILLFNQPGGLPATQGPATNLYFLFNEAGAAATSVPVNTGSTASGFDPLSLLAGARSKMWRSVSFSSAEVGYAYPADVPVNFAVIARADLMLSAAGKKIIGRQRSSSGAWSDIPGFYFSPLSASDLIGPGGQDLVVATTPTQLRGFGVFTAPLSGTEASMFSKLYAGTTFGFSQPPPLGIGWEPVSPGTYETPKLGTRPYEIERRFSMTFVGIGESEITAFRAKANLLQWPFYLYDSTGDIWEWQLEHVILTDFEATLVDFNFYVLRLDFARLRHYS